MTPENLFKDLQSIKNSNDNNLQEFLTTALKCGFVEKFNDGNERPCNKDDFSEAKKYHENHIIKKQIGRKLVKDILEISRPKLLKETWKYYPATVVMYRWLLQNIEQPDLSYHLPFILPTALLLVDDFVNENRIIGIHCLNHIINNLTLAELQLHGHGDVIYNALKPLVNIRDNEMINEVIPCVVAITSKMEFNLGNKNLTKWSRFDEVFELLLETMELETQIDLRDSYIRNLVLLLNTSDLRIIRWSKRLFRIFTEYVKTVQMNNSDLTINYCLKCMERYISVTKSAHAVYGKKLSFILLNILHCIPDSKSDMQRENLEKTIQLINNLNCLTKSDIEELRIELENNELNNTYLYNFILKKL
ncbi:hypothetical protein RUM43_000679 [Polyplax serrata]|uniref:Uncharacterized protein n=1 Tax=Polyplax serrata TaxID=468196 RepID=A0AAN8XSN5_POLSC